MTPTFHIGGSSASHARPIAAGANDRSFLCIRPAPLLRPCLSPLNVDNDRIGLISMPDAGTGITLLTGLAVVAKRGASPKQTGVGPLLRGRF